MRFGRSRVKGAALAGLAAAGIVIAHQIGYAVATTDPHARLEHLSRTGHGHWSFVVVASIALLLGGLALYLSGLFRARTSPEPPSFIGVAWRLAVLQSAGFLALEASERAAAGCITRLFDDPAVIAGLFLQVLFAALGAILLALLTSGMAAVLRRRRARDRRHASGIPRFIPSTRCPLLEVAIGAGTVRGPPLPA